MSIGPEVTIDNSPIIEIPLIHNNKIEDYIDVVNIVDNG